MIKISGLNDKTNYSVQVLASMVNYMTSYMSVASCGHNEQEISCRTNHILHDQLYDQQLTNYTTTRSAVQNFVLYSYN